MAMSTISDKALAALFAKHRVPTPLGPSGWKDAGNALLMKKELAAAAHCYSRGIEEGTRDPALLCVLLSNRAQAYLGLNEFVLALMDADAALAADPTHLKSHFRRGKALYGLERYTEAASAFELAGGQEKLVASTLERQKELSEGVYNWAMLLQETAKASESEHEVANFVNAAVELRDVPGKGRGWVLKSDVACGTLISVERAAAVAYPSAVFAKHKAPGELAVSMLRDAMRADRRVRHAVLELSLGDTQPRGEEAFAKDELDYLKSCVIHNGFSWSDSLKVNVSQRMQDHGYGLWVRSSMINHSCVPNCCYGFLANLMVVRAAKDLKAGDEITIAYVSAHDALQEREMKLKRRGFTCVCELCERQRQTDNDDFNSARQTVFQTFQGDKPVHNQIIWHGMMQSAEKVDDFKISRVVSRVIGGLSADRGNDFVRAATLWEEAWQLQTSEALMCAMWAEEANFCIMGIFAAALSGNIPLAESWTPRLDQTMRKFFPPELAGAAGNYAMVAYRMSKEAEAKAKQGPGMDMMM